MTGARRLVEEILIIGYIKISWLQVSELFICIQCFSSENLVLASMPQPGSLLEASYRSRDAILELRAESFTFRQFSRLI